MLGFTQMIPMRQTKADSDYMNASSAVEVEKKNYTVNQLSALAKQLLSMDNIDKKYKLQ
jgi:hypothetical protein